MELVIIWLGCGAVAAILASAKQRSAPVWFLIGVALGPIGVVASLFLRRAQTDETQHGYATGASRQCPFCAESVRRKAVKCKHCGSEIEPDDPDLHEIYREVIGASSHVRKK